MQKHIHPITIKKEDIDALQHINNVAYLRYVQDAAEAHWHKMANESLLKQYVWVALRHEIDYYKPGFLEDELHAETYVESFEGVKSIRIVEIKKGTVLLAKAKTYWCLLDAQTHQPKRIGENISSLYL